MGRGSVFTKDGRGRYPDEGASRFEGVRFVAEPGLEGLEIEAKIDVVKGAERMEDLSNLSFLTWPASYEVMVSNRSPSSSLHDFHALGRGLCDYKKEHAFTVMRRQGGDCAWKFKGRTEIVDNSVVIVLERKENVVKSVGDSRLVELMEEVTRRAAEEGLKLWHVGTLEKTKNDVLVYSTTTNRAFVITPSICEVRGSEGGARLYQIEVEYVGLRERSGLPARDVYSDVAALSRAVKDGLREGVRGEHSTLTKFDWLMKNVRASR